MKRILTGITPSGYPHLGNYVGAIKPSLDLAKKDNESFKLKNITFLSYSYNPLLNTEIIL